MDNNSSRPSRKRQPSIKVQENQSIISHHQKRTKNSNTKTNLITFECPVCEKIITGTSDKEILKNHFELDEYKECKQNGLYHCRPPCTRYFLRNETRDNHFKQLPECRLKYLASRQQELISKDSALHREYQNRHGIYHQTNLAARNYLITQDKNKINSSSIRLQTIPNLNPTLPSFEITNLNPMPNSDTESTTNEQTTFEVNTEEHEMVSNIVIPCTENNITISSDKQILINLLSSIKDQTENTVIPPNIQCFIQLEDMLRGINAPSNMFQKIIRWATSNASILSSQRQDKISLNGLYQIMQNNVFSKEISSLMMPKTEEIDLPSGQTVNLTYFEVIPAILELLSDPAHMKYDSLIFSKYLDHPKNVNKNPFFPPLYGTTSADDTIGHLITAKWYAEVYHARIVDKLIEILVPVLIYIDATAITNTGSISMEIISIALGIFTRKIRDSPSAWKTLGYIPSMLQNILENLNLSPQQKAEDYHFILKTYLDRIQDALSKKSFEWFFTDNNGNRVKKLLRFEVIFIMGDTKGQDILCGRYASHSTRGIGRFCTCSTEDSDNPFVNCTLLNNTIMNSKNEEQLNNASFRLLINHAFRDYYFGTEDHDIFTSTPPDTLHCFMLGICDRLYSSFLDNLTDKMYMDLNYNVARIAIFHSRQSELELYPEIRKFKDGITLRGIISAKQRLSRVFMIYLVLLTKDFHNVIFNQKGKKPKKKKRKKKNTIDDEEEEENEDKDDDEDGIEDELEQPDDNDEIEKEKEHQEETTKEPLMFDNQVIANWILAFEKTLIFYSFLSSHSIERHLVENNRYGVSIASKCIQNFLLHLRRTVNREEGYGLKLFKFHVHKHWPYFIEQYGAPWNYDTGRNESFHIDETKAIAKSTRRIAHTVDRRTCDGQFRRLILRKNMEKMDEPLCTPIAIDKEKRKLGIGRQFEVEFKYSECLSKILTVTSRWSKTRLKTSSKLILLDQYIIDELVLHLQNYSHGSHGAKVCKVVCFTQLNVNIGETADEEIRLHAHPCYYEDPWYDWLIIQWNINNNNVFLPAKLLLIIDFDKIEVKRSNDETVANHIGEKRKGLWLLVRSAEKLCHTNGTGPYKQNLLSTRYVMEKNTQLVPVESVHNSAFVIEASKDSRDSIIHIQHPFQWSELFQESLDTDVVSDGLKEKLQSQTFNSIF